MTDIFQATPPEAQPTADQLVGEGKRFASVDVLAASKIEADRTIAAREAELAAIRDEFAKQQAKLEVYESLSQQRQQEPARSEPEPTGQDQDPRDLATRIREEIAATRDQENLQRNVDTVAQRLLGLYGTEDKAAEVIRQKATDLGVSVQFLQDVASKSPKAFFTTIGLADNTPPATANPSRSDVNVAALPSTGVKEGTYAYYEAIRKSDPKLYFTPRIQNKMHQDALRLGWDAFNA